MTWKARALRAEEAARSWALIAHGWQSQWEKAQRELADLRAYVEQMEQTWAARSVHPSKGDDHHA